MEACLPKSSARGWEGGDSALPRDGRGGDSALPKVGYILGPPFPKPLLCSRGRVGASCSAVIAVALGMLCSTACILPEVLISPMSPPPFPWPPFSTPFSRPFPGLHQAAIAVTRHVHGGGTSSLNLAPASYEGGGRPDAC